MNYSNTISDVAWAMHSACITDLPGIEEEVWTPRKGSMVEQEMIRRGLYPTEKTRVRRPSPYELAGIELWQQTWSSTALGFGGIGGRAVTTANTIVVTGPKCEKSVYFGSRFAYLILKPNALFFEDVTKRQLGEVDGAKMRYDLIDPPAETVV